MQEDYSGLWVESPLQTRAHRMLKFWHIFVLSAQLHSQRERKVKDFSDTYEVVQFLDCAEPMPQNPLVSTQCIRVETDNHFIILYSKVRNMRQTYSGVGFDS